MQILRNRERRILSTSARRDAIEGLPLGGPQFNTGFGLAPHYPKWSAAPLPLIDSDYDTSRIALPGGLRNGTSGRRRHSLMTIRIPFVPIEFEISARRRTAPFRVRVRTLMITVAVVAVIVYLSLPFSAADQQLMTRYEQLGNGPSKDGLTKDQVISQIGRPSSAGIPGPKHCFEYNWEAQFDRPLSHVEYRLGVSIDPDTGDVLAWGPLDKTEYQGLDLVWYRLGRLLEMGAIE